MTSETETKTCSRAAIEWAQQLQHNDNIEPTALNETLVAYQINKFLESLDLTEMKAKVQSTKEYLDLVRTILEQCAERTKRMKVELELQLYKQNVKMQTETMQEVLQGEPGLTPGTLRKIEAAMAKL